MCVSDKEIICEVTWILTIFIIHHHWKCTPDEFSFVPSTQTTKTFALLTIKVPMNVATHQTLDLWEAPANRNRFVNLCTSLLTQMGAFSCLAPPWDDAAWRCLLKRHERAAAMAKLLVVLKSLFRAPSNRHPNRYYMACAMYWVINVAF